MRISQVAALLQGWSVIAAVAPPRGHGTAV